MPFGVESSFSLVFPSFLLPSLPFPKRQQRTLQDNYDDDLQSQPAQGSHAALKSPHLSSIRCARCGTDICHTSQIISKGFTGRHGRAYLVSPPGPMAVGRHMPEPLDAENTLPNIITQKAVPRQLATGTHAVADINCMFCGSVLGWKYIAAEEESQRYKVGKYIIETKRITTSSCWEFEDDYLASSLSSPSPMSDDLRSFFLTSSFAAAGSSHDDFRNSNSNNNNTSYRGVDFETEFDSQDEDECEDVFTGVWSPSLARRRRAWRMNRK